MRHIPKTKKAVVGQTLKYGSSIKVILEKTKEVKITKQFGVEEIIMIVGIPGGIVPIKGIPKEIQTELVEVRMERTNASEPVHQKRSLHSLARSVAARLSPIMLALYLLLMYEVSRRK